MMTRYSRNQFWIKIRAVLDTIFKNYWWSCIAIDNKVIKTSMRDCRSTITNCN